MLIAGVLEDRPEDLLKQTIAELEVIETMSADMLSAWESGDAAKMESIVSMSLKGYPDILFVDDEPVLTNLARQMLEGLGYTVTTTTDSEHALDLFRSGPHLFDLVITDMTMPKMTGEMLAQELLRIRHDVPVILCTGYSASMSEDRAIEMGIRAFALKPLLKRDLANKIRSVLDKEM